MEPDFSGYATRAGLKCSDGRIIGPGAFEHQDGQRVPLVWHHMYDEPSNILGHAILSKRPDGVYAQAYFNSSEPAQQAKVLVQHGDITALSIRANKLVEKNKTVLHGAIQEVSLVMAGANPGAYIDNVNIQHGDSVETLQDEAIIYTGLTFEHASQGESMGNSTITHEDEDEKTVQDVYDAMSDEEKQVVHFMVTEALKNDESDDSDDSDDAEHSDTDDKNLQHQEGSDMTRNVFEQNGSGDQKVGHTLTHDDMKGIIADAQARGSMKAAVEDYALKHGIEDIELLFPEARNVRQTPDLVKRDTGWVASVINGASKLPFSRIKSMSADLTHEDARALGYIKGNMKKEEFFGVARRITTPQTIYKKQKLDRDDIIDITDFDVVAWLKAEMRLMLEEELARAALVGDGRDVESEDKIQETHIRPIANDDPFYAHQISVPANVEGDDLVDVVVRARRHYKGTGSPTFYTTEEVLTELLLIKDADGRRIYRTEQELASAMRVSGFETVEVMESHEGLIGIMVNIKDYTFGADRGGQVTMFDDFDIDYNQHKYLIETRGSGALTRPKSAVVFKRAAAGGGDGS